MSESVRFWLDNKMSAGIKVASIGDQVLVVYRDKYYVVERDAVQMRGGKPLRYSKSSMPAIWKKAINGETPLPAAIKIQSEEALPIASTTNKPRTKKKTPHATPFALTENQVPVSAQPPAQSQPASEVKPLKNPKNREMKPVAQTTVATHCPNCNHKHEIHLDKGKGGKPFFMSCARCKAEFAVRFVPVTMYQAQVAGFR